MEASKLSVTGKRLFEVIEFDEGEKLLYEIRKHPFGLVLIYVSGIAISLLLFGVIMGVALFLDSSTGQMGNASKLIILGGAFLALLALGVTYIAGYLYKSNVVIVTSEKLAQVLYRSLFDRKISQLSIGDVQDVTVRQNGVFSRMFNYGTLVVETAGEQQNYMFTYTPEPYQSAKMIVGAHEENLKQFGN